MINESNLKVKLKWENMKLNGYSNHLIIKNSKFSGLGVFANKDFLIGEEIEYCHLIEMEYKQKYIHDVNILKYAYWYDLCECHDCRIHGKKGFILLGNGSIYNSSESQEGANAFFEIFPEIKVTVFTAIKKIKKDEEILVWWGQNYYDKWCSKKKQK
jgi:hypothetical protein